MILKRWDDLPDFMKNERVWEYYEILEKKKMSLILKRLFDLVIGFVLLVILVIPMGIIALLIKLDSKGPIFFRQERITIYGKKFKIHKFRTMVNEADKIGMSVTVDRDSRITRVGAKLRDYRLDELPQLLDVLNGNMSFVGTRPEVVKYVEKYNCDMMATLLLPAGITSEASIRYKDEAKLLGRDHDIDRVYVEKVLPEKMKYNLKSIKEFSIFNEIKIMIKTIFTVMQKEYE